MMLPPMPTAIEIPGRFCSAMATRTIGRARSTAAVHCVEGAGPLTDGTSGGCPKRGALMVALCMRNAAHAADQVGSLLRPEPLAQLRTRFRRGEVDGPTLRAAEDRAVRDAVQRLSR